MGENLYQDLIDYADRFHLDPALKWFLLKLGLLMDSHGGSVQISAEALTPLISGISTRTVQRHVAVLKQLKILIVTKKLDKFGKNNANVYSLPVGWR